MAAMRLSSLAVVVVVILANFCTGDVVGVTCPENYRNIRGKCLMFAVREQTWGSAVGYCDGMGGELATHLDDCLLYEDLLWYINSHSDLADLHFWVGGSDGDVEGTWKWTNGDLINMSALYWGRYPENEEPNGGTDANHLLLFNYCGRSSFYDNHSSEAHSAICQTQPIVKV